jgi:ribosome modulation factor
MPGGDRDRNEGRERRVRHGSSNELAPWRDRDRLSRWLVDWRGAFHGRAVHSLAAGAGWISVQMLGEERASLFLGALPGAVVLFPYTAPLPAPLRKALPPIRRHPLVSLLSEARLSGATLLADDLVLQLTLTTRSGPRFLRHQLFGSRGGSVLLGADGRLHWTAYPSPHPSLIDPAARTAGLPTDPGPSIDPGHLSASAAPDDHTTPTQGNATWSLLGLLHLARQVEVSLGDRLQQTLSRRLAASARLIENLSADLARADNSRTLREDAETLAAHLHRVRRGADSITCPSPYDEGERTITLDPALAPSSNLERLFRLARKAERGRQIIAERLAAARIEETHLREAADELAACLRSHDPVASDITGADADQLEHRLERLDNLQNLARRRQAILQDQRPGSLRRAPEEPARPFRRYIIDGKWEVWIGRSSRENDLLTLERSHPRDIWLHAQSIEGGHVVLRTQGKPQAVPRPVIERAAALAALFSKARNSSLVPVIWTERRYVRRPRGAAPGTAVCLRAESLFAAPGIEAGVEPA